jgi:hypothetical protein
MDNIYKGNARELRGEAGCSCASAREHEALVKSVDDSFKQDSERYKMRQDRNASTLRMNVLSQLNGHNN